MLSYDRRSLLRSAMVVGLAATFGMFGVSAFAAQGSATAELHAGILVSLDQNVIYAMAPGGGIDAVDLNNGSIVWQTKEASKPLLIDGNLLIAQGEPGPRGELSVVAFDTNKAGAPQLATQVALPTGIQGLVSASLRGSFETKATLNGDEVLLDWTATVRQPRGVSPMMQEQLSGPALDGQKAAVPVDRSQTRFNGAVSLNMTNGKTTVLDNANKTRLTGAAVNVPLQELLGDQKLAGINGRQFLAIDQKTVLASEVVDTNPWARYQWTLFDRQTGTQVGQVRRAVAATPFLVAGDRVVTVSFPSYRSQGDDWQVEALTIKALDLLSGSEQWSHDIRDTSYRGPFPH